MKVGLGRVFIEFGVPSIGLASVFLFCASFLLASGDAKTVRSAASIGILLYIGCLLAKFTAQKENTGA